MEIFVFGETRAKSGDRTISARDLGGVKPRRLLEFLAINCGQPVSKSRLVEVLWPDLAPAGAIATMETYVSLLRRVLEPGVPARSSVIRTVTGGYCLDAERVIVDLVEFHDLAERARAGHAAPCGELATLALDLVTGDVLASEPGMPWAIEIREQFSHELTALLTTAAGCALERGDHANAVALSRRAIERDPYGEGAVRHLITALWRMGRRGEALREYDNVRRTLVDELGVEPSTETRDLHLAILLEDEVSDWSQDSPADEDTLVLELVRLVRMMVREHGVEQTRMLVHGLTPKAA